MSRENVYQFETLLNEDGSVRERLKELAEAYGGDREDERAVFEAVIAPLAEEVGLPYTYDEVIEFAREKDDDEDLTPDELKAMSGGSYCVSLGFNDQVSADACNMESIGACACAYAGVGILLA